MHTAPVVVEGPAALQSSSLRRAAAGQLQAK